MNFDDERVLFRAFGTNLISYRWQPNGEMTGTGLLNPLLRRLELLPILMIQFQLVYHYRNLARWRGKRVSNTMAPPSLSGPQWRLFRSMVMSLLTGIYRPLAINFAVTYRCPGACPHCSAARHRKPGAKEITTAEAKKIIDDVIDLGASIIGFTGGEPLYRKDIFELIAHVNKRKAVTFLFTNGQMLDETNIRKLGEAGLYCAYLSVDSPILEEHDRGRGIPGLFAKCTAAVESLKKNGVLVSLGSFATRSGTERGDYRKIYELGQKLGCHNVLCLDYIPTGRAMKNPDEMLTRSQRQEIFDFGLSIFKRRSVPPFSAQAWQNSIEGYLGGIGCFSGNREIYVTAYGDVGPCDFTPLSFGNLREEPMERIWRRMRSHPSYRKRSQSCKMQNAAFRKLFIDAIPEGAPLPYPIARLPKVDYRDAAEVSPAGSSGCPESCNS